jgi:hypothetical protein
MFANQPGATKGDPKAGGGYWAKFDSPEAGFLEIQRQVELDAKPERKHTVETFIKKYAPPKENNTDKYVKNFINFIKEYYPDIKSTMLLSDVLAKAGKDKIAKFISMQENINYYKEFIEKL